MKKLQKVVFIGMLILSTMYFVFTLGISTNVALGSTRVAELYAHSQTVNKQLFPYAVWLVVLSGLSYILGNHKNVNFFIPNFVTAILSSVLSISVSILTVIKIIPLRTEFIQTMDPSTDNIKILIALNYAKVNTFIYDAGIFVSVALIVCSSFSIYFIVKKYQQKVNSAKMKKLSMEV